MPLTVLRCASSFPIKDKTAPVKRPSLKNMQSLPLGRLLHVASQGQNLHLHPIIFHRLLGPATLLHHRVAEDHQGLLRLDTAPSPLLDLCVAFRTVDSSLPWKCTFGFRNFIHPCFIIYLAASLQSHLCFSVAKSQIPQGPALGPPQYFYLHLPRQCPQF